MFAKTKQKEEAINLRREGLTYSAILARVSVAKSTLSLWLRDVGLSERQSQKITKARLEAGRKGGVARRVQRIEKTKRILEDAILEIGSISKRDLWLIGIALYWAEGAKEKKYRTGEQVMFANSDPRMVNLFLKWLKQMKIAEIDFVFEIYIHEMYRNKAKSIVKSWSVLLNRPSDAIFRVYFKKDSKRRETYRQDEYIGLVRVGVRKSVDLNRRIEGWVRGICKYSGIV